MIATARAEVHDVPAAPAPRTDPVTAVLLALFVGGLAASITVAQGTLLLLAAWVIIRRRHMPPMRWPLLGVVVAFAAWTLVAALASDDPAGSVRSARSLLWLGTPYVLLAALPDTAAARRFLTALLIAVTLTLAAAPVLAASKPTKADVAIQKQTVLRKSDLPAGWKSSPDEPPARLPEVPACVGLQEANDALDPIATNSPDFWKSELSRASNAVAVLPNTKRAKGWLAPYREPDASTCLEEIVKKAFTQTGIQGVRAYVAPIDDTPRGADDAVGFEVQITATTTPTAQQPSQTVVIVYDVLLARVGRALTNFTFMNPTDPLPEQGELVDAVIGRMQDADL